MKGNKGGPNNGNSYPLEGGQGGGGGSYARNKELAEPYYGGGGAGANNNNNQHQRGNYNRNNHVIDEEKCAAKFMSFQAFCNSDEARNLKLVTPQQFQDAYSEYKESYKQNYVQRMMELESTFQGKVIQDRAKTSCVLFNINQRKEFIKKKAEHFDKCWKAGAFRNLKLMAPSISQKDEGVELCGEPPLMAKGRVQIVSADELRGTDEDGANLKLPDGLEAKAPLAMTCPLFHLDSDVNTIVLRELPDFISREDITTYLKQWGLHQHLAEMEITYANIPAIKTYWDSLGQGEVAEVPKLARNVHIQFETSHYAKEAVTSMQGRHISVPSFDRHGQEVPPRTYTLHPVEMAPTKELRMRILPSAFSHPAVVNLDLELSKELINELDVKFSILEDVMTESEREFLQLKPEMSYDEKASQLDLQLQYLAYVHSVDFYNAKLETSTCTLVSGCNKVTPEPGIHMTVRSYIPEMNEGIVAELDKMKEDASVKLRRHEGGLRKLLTSIRDPFPTPVDQNHPSVLSEWNKFVEENIVHAENQRARCGVCEKLFKGADFVTKHIANKHFDKIQTSIDRTVHQLMEERFAKDPISIYLLRPPHIDENVAGWRGGSGDNFALAQRDDYHRSMGGPVRRGHTPWTSPKNAYRDWDAPTVSVSRKNQSFRKLANYDDI